MSKSVKNIRTRNLNSPRPGTEIKVLLLRANLTQTQLAETLGVPITTLNMNIHGHRRNRRLQQRIARRLGVPVEEIFPNRQEAA